jgi:formylglycine-generating enzyme required for sulfatase activity/serine/threonine protein kinase
MEPSDPFQWTGATIDGKYRVDAAVGEGGFGVVYRGHHLGFDEPIAVKCLKVPRDLAGAARESFQKTFLEEGKLLHRLSRATAGIVQALDVGAAVSPSGAWTPYLVLEWLRGEGLDRDLAERRSRGAPPRTLLEAIALLAPAVKALAVAHAQGVAHRDIKPANLFLAEIGGARTLKVLDFGIAKVLSEVSSMTQALAETGASVKAFTPQYGAPEQFHRRFGATGPWTDVFALALVLIELASGQAALGSGDTTQLFIASSDLGYRPSLKQCGVAAPEAVEAVLGRALAVDPRERYHTAGELWDALEAALPEAAATAKRTPDEGMFKTPRPAPALSAELASMSTGEFLDASTTERDKPAATADRAASGLEPVIASTADIARRSQPTPTATTDLAKGGDAGEGSRSTPAARAAPPQRRRGPAMAIGAGALALVAIGGGVLAFQRRLPPPPPIPAPLPTVVAAATQSAPAVPPGMVRLPAGKLTMGSESGGPTEKPPHEVTFTKAFDLDRTEVTVADYQRCVRAGKCSASSVHGPHVEPSDIEKRGATCTAADPAKTRHPITCVDRMQAAAYCAWAGKRLPTEAEWEYAARGADGREYPWGNEAPDCERANVAVSPGCGRGKGTLEVGSAPAGASAAGALDMAGNAWEWVADGWDPGVYKKGAQTDPLVAATGDKGVLRGGSWDFAASKARSTFRLAFDRLAGDVATGMRCARTVDVP